MGSVETRMGLEKGTGYVMRWQSSWGLSWCPGEPLSGDSVWLSGLRANPGDVCQKEVRGSGSIASWELTQAGTFPEGKEGYCLTGPPSRVVDSVPFPWRNVSTHPTPDT